MFEIHDSVASLPGGTPTLRLLVQNSQEYLDNLAKEAGGDISLQRDLATAYEKLGNALGNPYESNLGDAPGAVQSFEKSLVIRKNIATKPGNAEDEAALAGAYRLIGVVQWAALGRGALDAGDIPKAIQFLQKAVAEAEHLHALSSTSWDATTLAQYNVWLGEALGKSGRREQELRLYQDALETYSRVANADPKDLQDAISAAACHDRIGEVWLRPGDASRAEEQYLKALALAIAITPKVPESLDARYLMAATYSGLGDVAARNAHAEGTGKGRFKFRNRAESWYQQSLAEWAKVPNPSHIAPNQFKVDVPSEVERRLARSRMELAHAKGAADDQ
jgi:tetratricopeptide (TPR) repeat protein